MTVIQLNSILICVCDIPFKRHINLTVVHIAMERTIITILIIIIIIIINYHDSSVLGSSGSK